MCYDGDYMLKDRRDEFKDRVDYADRHHRIIRRQDLRLSPSQEAWVPAPHPMLEAEIGSFTYCRAAVENLLDAADRGFLRVHPGEGDHFTIELLPLRRLPPLLGHLAEQEVYDRSIGQPVWGDSGDTPTYLQSTYFGAEGGLATHHVLSRTTFVRMYVETSVLQRARDIYLDPECLHVTPEEYPHAHMVFHGIPRAAIVSMEHVLASPERRRAAFSVDWPTDDELRAEESESERRLRAFLAGLRVSGKD